MNFNSSLLAHLIPLRHRFTKYFILGLVGLCSLPSHATTVQFQTSLGNFEVNLYDTGTPITVENFLAYVNDGSYTDTIIHRSMDNFVVQGGGFTWEGNNDPAAITTKPAITNEPVYSNVAGTIAMAKTATSENSATSQWFFNLRDNGANLDVQNGGFTVFGEVSAAGMAILDAINDLPTYNMGGAFTNIPLQDFTSQNAADNDPVTPDHVVTVYAIVVLDATEDTLNGKNPPTNERIKNQQNDSNDDGGGSTSWLALIVLGLLGTQAFAGRRRA